jgi:hypothetical protein
MGVGFSFYNSSILPKSFQFLIDPQFGTSSKDIIGNAWMSYNYFPSGGLFRKIQSKVSLKKYHDFYESVTDLRTGYLRFAPQISLHFSQDPASQQYHKVAFQSIHLRQEVINNLQRPTEIQNDWQNLYRIRYDYFDFKAIGRKEWWAELEYQKYAGELDSSESYLKATAAFTFTTPITRDKSFRIRLYGSYFLHNTNRNSLNYNTLDSRGSIALLGQSFNDYSRDQYFLNRQQNGSFTNQLLQGGGGFKDALGPSYDVGMSNDFAIAANFAVDLPVTLLVFFKPKLYFDVGYFKQNSIQNQGLKGDIIASSGFMLSYLDQGLEIYFPMWANEPISSIYKATGEGLFQKVSFKIDLHRLNPWDLIDDLNL